ncbi:MAG: dinitrogenase iron-molybdenum cofactor biosynthesis protein [Nitrososphaerota archaeon]|nr:dinitrogenase iron-molybdenum cofactor biosynthesis protein [Nitrososphaerota archaeon]
MKLAVVTDDMETISPHFGRAAHYLVYDVEGGAVRGRESREKVGHGPGGHHHGGAAPQEAANLHNAMLANVKDCEVMIAAGMGRPMYEKLREAGMSVYITRIRGADEAVRAFIDGSLDSHLELLH